MAKTIMGEETAKVQKSNWCSIGFRKFRKIWVFFIFFAEKRGQVAKLPS